MTLRTVVLGALWLALGVVMGGGAAALAVFTIVWAILANWAMYAYLGVRTTHTDGTELSIVDTIFHSIPPGIAFVVLIGFLVIVVSLFFRLCYRAWPMLLALIVVGTPLVVFIGGGVQRALWTRNGHNEDWSEIVAPPSAFAIACAVGFVFDALLDRRKRRSAARRAADVLCPSCGYDLRGIIAAGSSRCSECGAAFELVRVVPSPGTRGKDDSADVAARPASTP